MLPGEVKGARCPFFNPFKAIGAPRFLAEVVAKVSSRSQHHVGCSLGRYATTHDSACNRALQEPAADGQPVCEGAGSLVEIRVYRLRIEVIQPGILLRMWKRYGSCRSGFGWQKAIASNCVKELNAVEVLRLWANGRGADFLLIEQVFGAFQEVQAVGDNGATDIESRSSVPDAVQVPASDEKVGKRVIQAVAPLLASTSRLRRHYPRGEATILCEVWHLQELPWSARCRSGR